MKHNRIDRDFSHKDSFPDSVWLKHRAEAAGMTLTDGDVEAFEERVAIILEGCRVGLVSEFEARAMAWEGLKKRIISGFR